MIVSVLFNIRYSVGSIHGTGSIIYSTGSQCVGQFGTGFSVCYFQYMVQSRQCVVSVHALCNMQYRVVSV